MRRNLSALFLAVGLLAGSVPTMAQPVAAEAKPATPGAQPAASAGKITLNLEGATAEDAFDQIAKQAGVDLIVDNPSIWAQADLVFINVKDAAFWPTFMLLCQQSRITFDQYYDQNRGRAIRLYNSGNGENRYAKLPSAEADGFMVFAQSAQRNYSISYENPQAPNNSFTIQLMVLADPATPLQQMQPPTVTEAVDENGVSLVPTSRNPNNMYYGGNGRMESLAQQTGLSLSYPANAGKKIAKVKGYLRGTAVTKVEKIEIDDLMAMKEPLKKEAGEYDITIAPPKPMNETDKNNKQYQMKVTFRKKQRPAGTGGGIRRENQDYWSLVNGMAITDAEGKRYNNNGGNSNNGDGFYECTMQLYPQQQGMGAPAKLSWRMPAETKEIRVPFEMKDLQIP